MIVAKTAGFCFGVKRAMDIVNQQIESGEKPVYTWGPIIHNEEVVKDLERRGVRVLNTEEELLTVKKGTVILRSHGVAKRVYDLLDQNGIRYVDVTCPFVHRIHKIVQRECAEGRRVIVVGSAGHPEVQGIVGWGDERTRVIGSYEDFLGLEKSGELEPGEKITIVSQTTFNFNKFKELVEKVAKMNYSVSCVNTVCNATQERQAEAERIASTVDAMIVIGGRNSSNTQKLYEICSNKCKSTYYIQTLKDLKPEETITVRSVGITAGASTPNQIIEEVSINARRKF